MSKSFLFFFVIFLYSGAALSQGKTSKYLKGRFPEGIFHGENGQGACIILINHDSNTQSNASQGLNYSVFEIAHYSGDKMMRVYYGLNDVFFVGGRGDCPVFLKDSMDEVTVYNSQNSLCLSDSRTNHGGFQFAVENGRTVFRIFDDKKVQLSECRINI